MVISKKKFTFWIVLVILLGCVIGINIDQQYVRVKITTPQEFFTAIKNLPNQEKNSDYGIFEQTWSLIKQRYIKQPVTDKALFYGAMNGLVDGLGDPYSSYFNPGDNKKFKDEMSGSFEGIGIEIGIKDKHITVIAPLPDTPATKAGLMAGDIIATVDNQSTNNMSLDEAASKIRGKKGTPVEIGIVRDNEEKIKKFTITRDKIKIQSVLFEMKNNNIAYIRLSHFNGDTFWDINDITKKILLNKPKGLILDLRNNPGGYLDVGVDIAGLWTGERTVTYSQNAQNETENYQAQTSAVFNNIKTIVLINGGSASASEILAGALQDYKLATLIGEKTFGKGSVQELIPLNDGSSIKLTVAHWLTPNKRAINEVGIQPDIEIKITEKDIEEKKDPQLDKALELLK